MAEEKALLINIATILAKDVLLDSREKKAITYPSYPLQVFSDDDDDDDGLELLVFEMQQKRKYPFNSYEKVISLSDSSEEDYQGDILRNGRSSPPRTRRKDMSLHLEEHFTRNEFEKNMHMSKQTFNKILRSLTPFVDRHMKSIDGIDISEKTFISLGLWKLATDEHLEEMSRRFKIPLGICHWTINNFCSLLSSNLRIFAKWPAHTASLNHQGERFPKLSGIIALQQIDVFFESQDEEASFILQLICGLDKQIIDCHVDLAASYSFDRTPFAERMRSQHKLLPTDCYLIGDASLPLRTYLIRPFANPSTDSEKRFNDLLENKRSTMNCVLNKMVKRFHSLYALETKNIRDLKRTLETICVLHNLCQVHRDTVVEECSIYYSNVTTRRFGDERDEGGRRRRAELLESMNL